MNNNKPKYTKNEILKKTNKVPVWGQTIPLPYEITTPGIVMENLKTIKRLQLPANLSGKRVLDIGTWDGYYSFECEKRGAQVLAIDNLNRMQRPGEVKHAYQANLGFETIKDILGSKVKFKNINVYNINPKAIGKFDIVLFLGVLYHLNHPALALEKISNINTNLLYIETEFLRAPLINKPVLEYMEGDSYNNDPTNFCRPNFSWLRAVLTDLGYKNIEALYKSPISRKTIIKSIIKVDMFFSGRIVIRATK